MEDPKMIQIGLTGWGDHPDVYNPHSSSRDKLKDYSGHFPVVELDASFYAIQPERNIEKWIRETPDSFQFVVKAYQGITGHHRGELPFESEDEMFELFSRSIRPLKEAGKLAVGFVPFSPRVVFLKKKVDEIRANCGRLQEFELAIEFRHQSWYHMDFRDGTLTFLRKHGFIHSVCDEPQSGEGSIPLVPISTNKEKVLFRLHGRNFHGWRNPGDDEQWRRVRYLYDYNKEELNQISKTASLLEKQSERVYVLFNNNSGGHAASNAKQLQKMMGISYEGLAPKQLDLFEGEF